MISQKSGAETFLQGRLKSLLRRMLNTKFGMEVISRIESGRCIWGRQYTRSNDLNFKPDFEYILLYHLHTFLYLYIIFK
jgi:hypothetical protein